MSSISIKKRISINITYGNRHISYPELRNVLLVLDVPISYQMTRYELDCVSR